MTSSTHTLTLDQGTLDVTVHVDGEQGQPFLLLHGGGGPQTVTSFAGLLAGQRPARVFTPVHPGFDGTPRPDWLTEVTTLAEVYARLVRSEHPSLRNKVTSQAKLFPFLRWLLPPSMFEGGVRSGFGMDRKAPVMRGDRGFH